MAGAAAAVDCDLTVHEVRVAVHQMLTICMTAISSSGFFGISKVGISSMALILMNAWKREGTAVAAAASVARLR